MPNLISSDDPQLPGLRPTLVDQAMADLPSLWGRLRLGDRNGLAELAKAVTMAEQYLAAPELLQEVRRSARIAGKEACDRFLQELVSAWPQTTSRGDIAGFGAHLRLAVAAHRPTIYALRDSTRHLTWTMKWLPTIAEVVEAITLADKRMADVIRTLDLVPGVLTEAKTILRRGADSSGGER